MRCRVGLSKLPLFGHLPKWADRVQKQLNAPISSPHGLPGEEGFLSPKGWWSDFFPDFPRRKRLSRDQEDFFLQSPSFFMLLGPRHFTFPMDTSRALLKRCLPSWLIVLPQDCSFLVALPQLFYFFSPLPQPHDFLGLRLPSPVGALPTGILRQFPLSHNTKPILKKSRIPEILSVTLELALPSRGLLEPSTGPIHRSRLCHVTQEN